MNRDRSAMETVDTLRGLVKALQAGGLQAFTKEELVVVLTDAANVIEEQSMDLVLLLELSA